MESCNLLTFSYALRFAIASSDREKELVPGSTDFAAIPFFFSEVDYGRQKLAFYKPILATTVTRLAIFM
jgi:hypothetical protein